MTLHTPGTFLMIVVNEAVMANKAIISLLVRKDTMDKPQTAKRSKCFILVINYS